MVFTCVARIMEAMLLAGGPEAPPAAMRSLSQDRHILTLFPFRKLELVGKRSHTACASGLTSYLIKPASQASPPTWVWQQLLRPAAPERGQHTLQEAALCSA